MTTLQRLVFQPAARRHIQSGVDQLVAAVRPTLGPLTGRVGLAAAARGLKPELLDSGGLIARRITQLPDADADVGAMLLRQLLWRVHEDVGDGTATTAVLFQAILQQSLKLVAAGWNPMRLRDCLEAALPFINTQLNAMTQPVESVLDAARCYCPDDEVADVLAEIVTALGPYASVEIQAGHHQHVEREYIPGTFWSSSGLLAASNIADVAARSVEVEHPAILATDFDLEDPRDLEQPLRCAVQMGAPGLVIVARSVSDTVRGFLATARGGFSFQLACVKTPGQDTTAQMLALQDLARLTGCFPLFRAGGQSISGVTVSDLGRAQAAWATRSNFGIRDGAAEATVDAYIRELQRQLAAAPDVPARLGLYERMGRFLGASAILRVGGSTALEIKARQETARRALRTLRLAAVEGVVPGGGSALRQTGIRCADYAAACQDDEERAVYNLLARALAEPFRVLVANSGAEPAAALTLLENAAGGWRVGYDVIGQRAVDMVDAGIVDPTAVVQAAVQGAVKTAALCLTLDVIVHHRLPEQAINP